MQLFLTIDKSLNKVQMYTLHTRVYTLYKSLGKYIKQ